MWKKDPENDNGLYGVAVTGIKNMQNRRRFLWTLPAGKIWKMEIHKYCGTDDFF